MRFVSAEKLGLLGLALALCAGCGAPLPAETAAVEDTIPQFSEDYTDAVVWHIVGKDLDLEAIDAYPQKITNLEEQRGGWISFDLQIKNLPYVGLDPVPIDGQEYPDAVKAYLEPSEKVSWDGEEIQAFFSRIKGDNVLIYAGNAARLIGRTLTYDTELAQEITEGSNDTVNAEEALARGKGTCSEYTNLFLAAMRSRGIPARMESGFSMGRDGVHYSFHAWAEFYLNGYGWIPADAQVGHVGIPDSYIRLEQGLDFADMGKKLRDYQVMATAGAQTN